MVGRSHGENQGDWTGIDEFDGLDDLDDLMSYFFLFGMIFRI